MGASDEYAGLLEIKILCKLLKININIFMDHNGEFNLVSSMGTKYKRECNLVLRDEYYSLIRPNIQKKIDTREPYSRSVRRRKNYTGYSPGI
jgi:hypothetical protein